MSKNKTGNPIDGTLKRVHTEAAHFSSSDEESVTYSEKSKVTSSIHGFLSSVRLMMEP